MQIFIYRNQVRRRCAILSGRHNLSQKSLFQSVIVTRIEQTSLFSASELSATYSVKPKTESLPISREALQAWKQRVFEFQQQVCVHPPSQQGTLFDLPTSPKGAALPDAANPDSIHPFHLPQQNTEFWRSKVEDTGTAALYFVIDHELPILLYVGETVKSNQRWKGEHDCKRYLLNYVTAHRLYQLPVTVNISFWPNAPTQTRPRQRLESALIKKWKSPFNKENWEAWGTPFIGEKKSAG